MRKICLLMLVLLATASSALVFEPKVPESVVSGNYFPLTLKITNTDSVEVQDVDVILDTSSFLSVADDKKEIDLIQPGQSVILSWNIKVRSDASAGYEIIDVEIDEDGSDKRLEVPVLVKSLESSLEIKSVETIPEQVEPGNSLNVKVSVLNSASFDLKDIRVLLDLSQTPFAPKGGTEERIIGSMNNFETLNVYFDLTALPNSAPGIYKVPVKTTYFDEFGQYYSRSNTIALRIGAVPKLELTADGQLIQGEKGEITLKVVNIGLTPINFLTLNIAHSSVISAQSLYIGNLDVDDFQTEDLIIFANEPLTLPVVVEFKDANNKPYRQTVDLAINVLDETTAKQLGLKSKSNLHYLIGSVLLLGVVYFVRRKLKR